MKLLYLTRTLSALVLAHVILSCTDLDYPFSGVNPNEILQVEINRSKDTGDDTLPADGKSILLCQVELNDNVAYYKNSSLTITSEELKLSESGSLASATETITIPLIGTRAQFYVVAPRTYTPEGRFVISIQNAKLVQTINLTPSSPNKGVLTSTAVRANAGESIGLRLLLADTTVVAAPTSGNLRVDIEATGDRTGLVLPLSLTTVAETNGSATASTSIIATKAGSYTVHARVGSLKSNPITFEIN